MTSVDLAEAAGVGEGFLGRLRGPLFRRIACGPNPHFDLSDSHHWWDATVTTTRDDCRYVAYTVDRPSTTSTRRSSGSPISAWRATG